MIIFLALIPALIHLYIFVLESLQWGQDRTNRVFGLDKKDVAATKLLAFNQGFYNLFLAVAILLGLVLTLGEGTSVIIGKSLIVYATSSMMIAGLVLLFSTPRLWRSALIQAGPALVGLLAVII